MENQHQNVHHFLIVKMLKQQAMQIKNDLFVNEEAVPLDHLDIVNHQKIKIKINKMIQKVIIKYKVPLHHQLISQFYDEFEPVYNHLFNAEYRLLDGMKPNIDSLKVEDNLQAISDEFDTNIGNTLMRIINLLYYGEFAVCGKTIWNMLKNGQDNEQTEQLRSTVESLSVNLKHAEPDEDDDNNNDENVRDMTGIFELTAVLDPLSPNTQKLVSILYKLYNYNNLFNVKILFNPMIEMKDEINKYGLPKRLTRYYRYVLNTQLTFDNNNDLEDKSYGLFVDMPQEQVLTLGVVDTPGTWLYESLVGTYDLDNLLSSKTDNHSSTIDVEYQLEHVLIQGQLQLFDPYSKNENDGVDTNLQAISDTIVMENLRYFQLKSNPGINNNNTWKVSIREGRSSDVCAFKFDKKEIKLVSKRIIFIMPHHNKIKNCVGMEKEELLPKLTQEERQQQRSKAADRDNDGKAKDEDKVTDDKEGEGALGSLWNNLFGANGMWRK